MTLLAFLEARSAALLAEACDAMACARMPHYQQSGPEEVRARLQALLQHVVESLNQRSLLPVVGHAQSVGRERFEAGFDLAEVQVAFNVLEEVLWRNVLKSFPAEGFAEAIGMVSTVLGGGKDALARTYVSLASKGHAPSLDLRALFKGTSGF